MNSTSENEKEEKNERKNEILSWVKLVFFAIALALLLRIFVFEFVRVEQSSMFPTLVDQDKVFVLKIAYNVSNPDRGDIAIIHITEDKNYVKRVVGLPGETFSIKDSVVHINGSALDESVYLSNDLFYRDYAEITIPEGCYFVMGDNRQTSIDSRSSEIGFISEDQFIGKVVFRLSPFTWYY